MSLRIYVSGLHSDLNPSPGLGVARALRLGYPSAKLVGVDYSPRSSGASDEIFDEVIIMNSWEEVDLEMYRHQIEQWISEAESYWISGLDVETWWLASVFPNSERVLVPPFSALEQIKKPKFTALKYFPFSTPPYIEAMKSDDDIYEFFTAHGCDVWVKGPYYEAKRVRNWWDLKRETHMLSEVWGGEIYIQAHVEGREEALAYVAYRGELLDAVYMTKLITTREGKTWGGRIYEPPEEVLEALRRAVKQLGWTGGGEMEFIRTSESLYLIDWNPRFPAWIYGAVIAGRNLPAYLIEAASGVPHVKTPGIARDFVRIIYEVPSKFYINEPLVIKSIREASYKHPSGMPALSRRLKRTTPQAPQILSGVFPLDNDIARELREKIKGKTPKYVFLESILEKQIDKLVSTLHTVAGEFPWINIRAAYSIKTNPDGRVLEIARRKGLMAEAISQLEVRKATRYGFKCGDIILNGPGKFWPRLICSGFHAVFADSLSELRRILNRGEDLAEVVGVRIQHPLVKQRFGVAVNSFEETVDMFTLIKSINVKFGVHFHIPSTIIGVSKWFEIYKSIIKYIKLLESTTSKKISVVDIGGGWTPKSFDSAFLPRLVELVSYASHNLPSLEEFLIEPGKALVEPSFCLITRVLDVRTRSWGREVVIDASVAEMPLAPLKPHPILYYDEDTSEFYMLRRGEDRILGRLCMENDILAFDIKLPEKVKEGDIFVFLNVGAYDMSMSYKFGRG
jgi:diaminopimelate decarboxylase